MNNISVKTTLSPACTNERSRTKQGCVCFNIATLHLLVPKVNTPYNGDIGCQHSRAHITPILFFSI